MHDAVLQHRDVSIFESDRDIVILVNNITFSALVLLETILVFEQRGLLVTQSDAWNIVYSIPRHSSHQFFKTGVHDNCCAIL